MHCIAHNMIVLLCTQGEPVSVLPGVVASLDPNQHWYVSIYSVSLPLSPPGQMCLHLGTLSEVVLLHCGLGWLGVLPPACTHDVCSIYAWLYVTLL